jgi:hypothetical protein
MSAPAKSLLAIGAAFAAGVAVTAAYVGAPSETAGARQGMMGGSPEATAPDQPPRAAGAAARAPAPRVSEAAAATQGATGPLTEAWVDPVKQRTAAAAGTPPRPPLVFHMNRERAEGGAAHREEAAVMPPRRPKASEFLAKSAAQSDPDAANESVDRNGAARSSGAAPSRRTQASRQVASSQRRPSGGRFAASEAEQDEIRAAVERQARRAPVARRDFAAWPPDPYALRNPDGLDRYERDVADRPLVPRRRVTSAETGGVLRWLEEP